MYTIHNHTNNSLIVDTDTILGGIFATINIVGFLIWSILKALIMYSMHYFILRWGCFFIGVKYYLKLHLHLSNKLHQSIHI